MNDSWFPDESMWLVKSYRVCNNRKKKRNLDIQCRRLRGAKWW